MEPTTEPTNIGDELDEIRRNGDPRVSDKTRAAVRALTPQDWEAHDHWVDQLTADDFAE